MLKSLFSKLKIGFLADILTVKLLPDLQEYDIPQRPKRAHKVDKNKPGKPAEVNNGREYITTEETPGTFTTELRFASAPNVSSEVVLDAYDQTFLDASVGVKWRGNDSQAKVMKWHWLRKESAAAIEKFHRSDQTGALAEGYSERTAAKFIKAFYDADDEREKDGLPRQREPRNRAGNAFEIPPPPRNPDEIDW